MDAATGKTAGRVDPADHRPRWLSNPEHRYRDVATRCHGCQSVVGVYGRRHDGDDHGDEPGGCDGGGFRQALRRQITSDTDTQITATSPAGGGHGGRDGGTPGGTSPTSLRPISSPTSRRRR